MKLFWNDNIALLYKGTLGETQELEALLKAEKIELP